MNAIHICESFQTFPTKQKCGAVSFWQWMNYIYTWHKQKLDCNTSYFVKIALFCEMRTKESFWSAPPVVTERSSGASSETFQFILAAKLNRLSLRTQSANKFIIHFSIVSRCLTKCVYAKLCHPISLAFCLFVAFGRFYSCTRHCLLREKQIFGRIRNSAFPKMKTSIWTAKRNVLPILRSFFHWDKSRQKYWIN